MRKTTVYIDESCYRSLKQLAKQRGQPDALLVREALARYLQTANHPTLKSLGIGQGPAKLGERVDELLADGFGEDSP
jgi:predicted transcriptional regulator